ncbi:MAG TPA: acyl carrier protein [Tepidisphaeraceae bacterium]|jgi:acyl carrier protein|nr:acyl carrier protein [Tepidisphaeraceae bacterium]
MEAEILAKVIELAAEEAGMEPRDVTAQSHFINDLKFDSLSRVEFAMTVEDEFEMSVPDEDLERFQLVGDVVSYIEAHRQPTRAA